MASRALAPIVRRSVAASRVSSKALRGGSPPMPAYVRIPAPSEPVSTSFERRLLSLGCVLTSCTLFCHTFHWTKIHLVKTFSWWKTTIVYLTTLALLNWPWTLTVKMSRPVRGLCPGWLEWVFSLPSSWQSNTSRIRLVPTLLSQERILMTLLSHSSTTSKIRSSY